MAKKSLTTTPTSLHCLQCHRENELQRIYCHQCGERLDRSLLTPPPGDSPLPESADAARARLKKIFSRQSSLGFAEIKTALNTLFYAAISALIFLTLQAPDHLPSSPQTITDRLVGNELQDALNAPNPVQLTFTEPEVNRYLRQLVKGEDGSIFQCLYANLLPDQVHFGAQQSLFGYSIYSGVQYRFSILNHQRSATLVAGNFGRLPVHPFLMSYLDFFFEKIWNALPNERQQLDHLQKLQLHQGSVTLITKDGKK